MNPLFRVVCNVVQESLKYRRSSMSPAAAQRHEARVFCNTLEPNAIALASLDVKSCWEGSYPTWVITGILSFSPHSQYIYGHLTLWQIPMANHHFQWKRIKYQLPFSIVILVYQRVLSVSFTGPLPRCSMVLVYLSTFGWFFGPMLVNILYVEHMG